MANKVNLSSAIKQVVLKELLGSVIDLTRISEMSERAHRQFCITIKKEFFEKVELLNIQKTDKTILKIMKKELRKYLVEF